MSQMQNKKVAGKTKAVTVRVNRTVFSDPIINLPNILFPEACFVPIYPPPPTSLILIYIRKHIL